MINMPAGMTTFLFVELVADAPPGEPAAAPAPVAVAHAHALIQAAISTQGGYLFQWEATGGRAAFTRAPAALAGALAAQRALEAARAAGGEPGQPQARMALH